MLNLIVHTTVEEILVQQEFKNNDAYLLATISTIIAGFFYGVFSIAKDEEKKVCYAK